MEHDGKPLILKDRYGEWDMPGGRIQKREFNAPLEGVMKRKITEELEKSIRYKLGGPVVLMRHERIEKATASKVRIFVIGYRAAFLERKIRLSKRHTRALWVPIKSFDPSGYFKGGWLRRSRITSSFPEKPYID